MKKLLLLPVLAILLASCGVKSDLMTPGGAPPVRKDRYDPSRPPNPIGR